MPRNVLIIQETYSKKSLTVNENNSKVLKKTKKDHGNTTETVGIEKGKLSFKIEKGKAS